MNQTGLSPFLIRTSGNGDSVILTVKVAPLSSSPIFNIPPFYNIWHKILTEKLLCVFVCVRLRTQVPVEHHEDEPTVTVLCLPAHTYPQVDIFPQLWRIQKVQLRTSVQYFCCLFCGRLFPNVTAENTGTPRKRGFFGWKSGARGHFYERPFEVEIVVRLNFTM